MTKEQVTNYYGAFGSNLNKRQMKERCPDSIPYKAAILNDHMLCFKSVANVIPDKNFQVPIGIYQITRTCEVELDRYESFPSLYRKKYLDIGLKQKSISVMIYVMNQNFGFGKPSISYYRTIAEGYIDWGLDNNALIEANKYAIKHDNGTSYRSHKWDNKI